VEAYLTHDLPYTEYRTIELPYSPFANSTVLLCTTHYYSSPVVQRKLFREVFVEFACSVEYCNSVLENSTTVGTVIRVYLVL
jgi:hypothetical protein